MTAPDVFSFRKHLPKAKAYHFMVVNTDYAEHSHILS